MLLEQLGLPIPVAPILILAGAMIAGGKLSFALVLSCGIAAALIGDFVWYQFGKKKGRAILSMLCRLSLSPESCVKKTENSFWKYGVNSLLFAKFVPGLNTVAPPMAGMFQVSLLRFLWRDLIGILLYILALVLPGYFFEKAVFEITGYFEHFGKALLWIILGGLAAYVAMKYLRLRMLQRFLSRERITPEELHQKMVAGERLVVVDLRTNVSGEELQGLPGSIRINPAEIDQHLQRLERDKWIVMYCT
jgi:membrane protein DedA with SNARE-associated domain